ncbi:tyrosine-type recombinase/integrase [Nocardia beijingensis]
MSRRVRGGGSVYQRKDGRWEGAAYLGTVSGKVRRIRVYGKTRKEANDKLTIKMADVQRGIPAPDRSWLIAEYLDYWMREVAPSRLRPSTMELYESAIRLHLKPMVGFYSLERLSVPILQQLLNQQLAQGKTLRTVRMFRTVLSAALTRAMREELVTRNVARLVELEADKRDEIVPWTIEEANRFLRYAQNHPLYPAFLMLVVYGIRRGEVLGLRWSDIDWERNTIHIRQQLQQIKNHLEVGPVKTDAGKRDLPLLPVVRTVLSQLQAHTATPALDSGSITVDGVPMEIEVLKGCGAVRSNELATSRELSQTDLADIIIRGRNGMPLWPRNFGRVFQKLAKEAGLRRIKLHWLRHGTATILKNLKVQPRDAQIILGHAHISTTLQIYQHGDPETQKTALDQAGRVLTDDVDGYVSRQTLPSMSEIVVRSASIQSGGSGGARTLDTLLKSVIRIGHDSSLISVIHQLRARTNAHIFGSLAVRFTVNSRQSEQPNVELWQWISLRDALAPQPRRFVDRLAATISTIRSHH